MMRRVSTLLAGCVLLAACDQDMDVNPAPVPATSTDAAAVPDAAADVAQDDSGEVQPVEAGPLRRTVMQRSPFGGLEHTDNLLIDGEMEMSAGAGQTPWLGLSFGGQAELVVETGGRCRSGLRCLVLNQQVDSVLGYGVAAGDKPLEFWMWAKVPGNDCNVLTVYLFPRMTMYISMFHQVQAEKAEPNADGWCRYHALRNPMDESTGVYVEASLLPNQRVILDEAVLRPADGLSPTSLRSLPVSKADHARIVKRLAPVLRQRWIGPAPSPREVFGDRRTR